MKGKMNTLKGILSYLKPYALPFLIGALLYSSQSFCNQLLNSFLMNRISAAMLAGVARAVWTSAGIYIALLIAYFVLLGYAVYLYVRYAELATKDIKHDLFRAFVTASVEGRGHSGEGIASINTEADLASGLYDNSMCGFVGCVIDIVLSGAVIFAVNFWLGITALGVGLLALLLQTRLARPLEKIAGETLDANASATKTLSAMLAGGASIRVLGLQKKALADFDRDNGKLLILAYKEAYISMWRNMLTTLQGWLSMAGIFSVGGYLVATGRLGLPELLMVPGLCTAMAMGMSNVGAAWAGLQGPLAAGARVLETMATGRRAEAIAERKAALETPWNGDSTLRLDNISFRYLGAKSDALSGISLIIPPKRMVAIIGESGSGKSTLLRAIIGMYERDDLAIAIGDMEFTKTPAEKWRKQFAYVDQNCTLFNMTIAENIALGNENATREEIIAAAKEAQADEFISGLPQGYDTPCTERGGALSGGQKQRIAIARALVRKAPVLVFDEATASLDAESERQVMATIDRLRKDHTVLITTHSLHLVKRAEEIVELVGGKIVTR